MAPTDSRGGLPRLAALVVLFAASPAWAYDYGTPILVRSEEDIYELELSGEIDEEARDQLLDLFTDPLDLNAANREQLQTLPGITYAMADEIVARRAAQPFTRARQLTDLVDREIWLQVKPFVFAEGPSPARGSLKGQVSVRLLERRKDEEFPVITVKARQKYRKWLDSGIIVAEQERPFGVEYGETDVTLEGVRPVVRPEKVYVSADRGAWSVIAGNYMAGFGERLTFDVTDKLRPDGFYNDLRIYEDGEKMDSYSVPRRLFGLAGSIERPLGSGPSLEATVFASSDSHDLYYTYITPHDYTVLGDEEVLYPTFPRVYREDILGLHAGLAWSQYGELGVTGWVGHVEKAYAFDFTGTTVPNRPWYGAVGMNGEAHLALVDVYGEVALTDTGGTGARVETVVSPMNTELSVAMRYYGTGFDNPHSRAKAQADTFAYDDEEAYEQYLEYLDSGGYRDRDELGPQVNFVADPWDWLRIRVKGDVWRRMSLGMTHAYAETRLDVDPVRWLGFDFLGSLRDKDIRVGGRDQTYSADDDLDEHGHKLSLGSGVRLTPVEPLILQAFHKQGFEDVSSRPDAYERVTYTWVKAIWDITESAEVAARYKIYDERPGEEEGMRYRSVYGQFRVKLPARLTLAGRYEVEWDLDDPEAEPDPEQYFKVGLDWRY